MTISQREAVRRWYVDGKQTNIPSIQFSRDEVLGFDGTPMIARTDIEPVVAINIDAFLSKTTRIAMGKTWRRFKNSAIVVPFSSIKSAGELVSQLKVINLCQQGLRTYPTNSQMLFSGQKSGRRFITLDDGIWHGIVEVPDSCETYEQAKDHILYDLKSFKRQGEWLFLPSEIRPRGNLRHKHAPLDIASNHYATEMADVDGKTYVRGTIRHHPQIRTRGSWYDRRFRPMLRLGKQWHEVRHENFINSFKAVR